MRSIPKAPAAAPMVIAATTPVTRAPRHWRRRRTRRRTISWTVSGFVMRGMPILRPAGCLADPLQDLAGGDGAPYLRSTPDRGSSQGSRRVQGGDRADPGLDRHPPVGLRLSAPASDPGLAMGTRLARDDEVARWREHGWVLLEGLVGTDEIDAATEDLHLVFPTAEEYHADPEGETERRLGRPAPVDEFPWPPEGPGFRHDQHRWAGMFPFPGTGALNRLVVHPSLVDFASRALGPADIRLYQAQVSAKYTGITN